MFIYKMNDESEYRILFKKQIDFLASLEDTVQRAVKNYTSVNYIKINNFLRGTIKFESLPERSKKTVGFLLSIFEKIPPLEKHLTVYRGVAQNPINFKSHSFTSTSISPEPVIRFMRSYHEENIPCCLMEITLQPGCKVLPLFFPETELTYHRGEKEVLLDISGDFIYKAVEIKTYKKNQNDIKVFYFDYIKNNFDFNTFNDYTHFELLFKDDEKTQ